MKLFLSRTILAFFVAVAAAPLPGARAGEAHGGATDTSGAKPSFNTGEYVMEHITDSHEWHIVSFGDTHITIPLPVILYSKNSGFHIFLSSVFHHGHASHKGFLIPSEGKYKGKVIETDASGTFVGKPIDLSVTKTVAGGMVTALLLVILLTAAARKALKSKGRAPSGLLNLIEPIVVFIRDEVAIPALGEKKQERFLPYLLSLFCFILLGNLAGLIPLFPLGFNLTGNISVTLTLALFTFLVTSFSGNRHYWKEVFNPDVPWWMKYPIPLMPLVEFAGLFIKPVILMVRLFANMMAGHMILTVFVSLIFVFGNLMGELAGWIVSPVSVLFSVFILVLDILVSFIQAFVFTLLSALYFGMATAEHHMETKTPEKQTEISGINT